jgi:hypothetical protein
MGKRRNKNDRRKKIKKKRTVANRQTGTREELLDVLEPIEE